MNILHYTLGLPPKRSGGLTKYATDLMLTQSGEHNVSLLYPGRTSFFAKKRRIKPATLYKGVNVYELYNPTLVPLLHGVSNPEDIIDDNQQLSLKSLEKFYINTKPDIFHIHTWMGMPKELIFFLKENGVKIVYTTHDYFGLCPKVNFINEQNSPCPRMSNKACFECNATAPSSTILKIRNSRLVLNLKNNRLFRKILGR